MIRKAKTSGTKSAVAQAAPSIDDLLGFGAPAWDERADCCGVRAMFRVVLPAVRRRTGSGEVFLCGHHYRAQTAALLRDQASVFDRQGRLQAGAATLS
jgi:hypothetical protein